MLKRLIIYDLDGTLVDTSADIVQSINHMLGALGVPPLTPPAIVRFIGRGLHSLVGGCLGSDETALIERGVEIYRTHYAKHLLDHTALYPSAQLLLERFTDRRQAVVTNKPNPFTQAVLSGLGVMDYFTEVIAGNSGYPRKPDPTGMRAVMARSGIGAQETVFVGDSTIDIETGRNAGVQTVAVEHGFGERAQLAAAGPDNMVRDLARVLELAGQQGW